MKAQDFTEMKKLHCFFPGISDTFANITERCLLQLSKTSDKIDAKLQNGINKVHS